MCSGRGASKSAGTLNSSAASPYGRNPLPSQFASPIGRNSATGRAALVSNTVSPDAAMSTYAAKSRSASAIETVIMLTLYQTARAKVYDATRPNYYAHYDDFP